jgi:hypothetical protein
VCSSSSSRWAAARPATISQKTHSLTDAVYGHHPTPTSQRWIQAKGADLRRFDQAALDAIAAELNGRPRQPLGFKTPSEVLAEALR